MKIRLLALACALAACGPVAAPADPRASCAPPTPAPRVALPVSATGSTTHGELLASNAVDGRADTKWSSTRPVAGSWLRLDPGAPAAVAGFRLVQTEHVDWRASTYALQSADATSGPWADQHVAAAARTDSGVVPLAGGPVTARYWRVLATAGGGNGWEVSAVELFPPVAASPSPADGCAAR